MAESSAGSPANEVENLAITRLSGVAEQGHVIPRVVVIGAGFGGLEVARGLKGARVDVTLVDQHNFHTFQPLLYQVATPGVEVRPTWRTWCEGSFTGSRTCASGRAT